MTIPEVIAGTLIIIFATGMGFVLGVLTHMVHILIKDIYPRD